MPVLNKYQRLRCDEIIVRREERQRTIIDTSDLDDSIKEHGVINPIIVTKARVLVAGERRLSSSIKMGLVDIPVRYFEELSAGEVQVIELLENLKRKDLPWRDEVRAVAKLHQLYLDRDPEWTQTATAKAIGVVPAEVSHILRVFRNLDDPAIAQASGIAGAYNVLSRRDERMMQDTLSDILEAGQGFGEPTVSKPTTLLDITAAGEDDGSLVEGEILAPAVVRAPSADESILNLSFLEWAPAYSGPKFNFIHCDFPYGINLGDSGEWSGKNSATLYDDSAETYWALCAALAANLDRIMTPSGHIMFWYHMDWYCETLAFFRKAAPDLNFQSMPLIWHKTDNVGIMPDPKRGPRRVYETALIASRDDRLIVKPVSNAYGAPTDKAHHPSTKPDPVLKHFFQMFVDTGTKLLDPTCGSGSALRAAEAMGAVKVLGLEVDPEHCTNARSALRQFRTLRSASK